MFKRNANYATTDLDAQTTSFADPATDFARQSADYAADLTLDAKKARKYAELSAEFAEHQRELHKLGRRMDNLQRASRGGGFPWSLLLLLGSAYLLYRSNQTVRTRVNGLLSGVMPSNNDTQSNDTQRSAQAHVVTPTPTVNAGVTPGVSGNEAYGMSTGPVTGSTATGSSVGSPVTGSTTPGSLGGTAPTPSMGTGTSGVSKPGTTTTFNSKDDKHRA